MKRSFCSSKANTCLLLLLITSMILAAPAVVGATVLNVDYLSDWDPDPAATLYDVDVVGNLAYVASYRGLHIVDISDKATPVEIGFFFKTGATRVKVVGNYAFLAYGYYTTNAYGGLRVLDISDPADIKNIASYQTSNTEVHGLFVGNDKAYITAQNDGLYIFNVSDLSACTETSQCNLNNNLTGSYSLGSGHWAHDVYVDGDLAYIADGQAGMTILNVAPATPTYVGSWDSTNTSSRPHGIFVENQKAYLADAGNLTQGYLWVIDVSTPGTPVKLGSIGTTSERVMVSNQYAFMASNEGALYVADVSNSASPAIAGVYTTPYESNGLDVVGDMVYLADRNGLYILRFTLMADSDGDGVLDGADSCPDTEAGDAVDTFGCSSAQNLAQILVLYGQLDLKGFEAVPGLPTNGPATNMASLIISRGPDKTVGTVDGVPITVGTNKEGGIECGGYQGTLIMWLEALRKSSTSLGSGDRTYGDLFSNVDYGPVQTYWFAHQAVVIYPKGTNWKAKDNGIVLDPWFVQNNKSYPVYGWGAHFPGVSTDLVTWLLADESSYYTSGFPMYGTGYSDEIEAAVAAARAARVAQIQAQKNRMKADCPVGFHLVDTQSGNRIGYYEGEGFVNEIPGAFVTMGYITGEEDAVWYFSLPEANYQMEGTGLSAGEFTLNTAYENVGILDYGTNPITDGGTASLVMNSSQPTASLELPSGAQVPPTIVQRPGGFMPSLPLLLLD